MTEILLIRHGETAWNAVKRLQGHLDIPLNAEGTRQAKALAYALQNEKLDAVISSDLQRAVQTAGEIARLQGVSTRLDAGLRERCLVVLKDNFTAIYRTCFRSNTRPGERMIRTPNFHRVKTKVKPFVNFIDAS